MTPEQYHRTPGISASMLKLLAQKTPLHVWYEYIRPDRELRQPTASMKMGTLVHAIVLEEQSICDRFVVYDGNRRTKTGQDEYQAIIAAGREPISTIDMAVANAIAMSVKTHPVAGPLFESGWAEISKFRNRGDAVLPQKCRIDFMSDSGMIIELKTTADASPSEFARQVYKMSYHLQAAVYMDMAGVDDFIFVSVETKPPYPVGIYTPSDDVLRHGRDLYTRTLAEFDECWLSGKWPGYECGLLLPPGSRTAKEGIGLGELEMGDI